MNTGLIFAIGLFLGGLMVYLYKPTEIKEVIVKESTSYKIVNLVIKNDKGILEPMELLEITQTSFRDSGIVTTRELRKWREDNELHKTNT